jgi:hypothetical protein
MKAFRACVTLTCQGQPSKKMPVKCLCVAERARQRDMLPGSWEETYRSGTLRARLIPEAFLMNAAYPEWPTIYSYSLSPPTSKTLLRRKMDPKS